MTLTTEHKEHLHQRLQDREYAEGYLSACAAEGQEALLVGLRHVAEAQGGVGQLAKETELNRESLYRMLSENGNPTLESILLVLDSLGIDLQFSMRQAS
ncbi:MAG: putative addiction module antidote protein [Pirellulales bacterium]|nr:putative addiction module antidote protein [Pirellulales bacterium]